MARTPLLNQVEDAMGRIAAEDTGVTRREIVKRAAVAGVGLTVLGRFAPLASGATAPRVAIVGGGLAGLTAALRLKQAGVNATVYEASSRLGGRCFTGRGVFADEQIFEHGGELIDNGHIAMKQLAQELGLDLDNLVQGEVAGTEMLGHFDGRPYSVAAMTADLKTIWQQLHKDTAAASYPTTYLSSTERGRQLDQLSIARVDRPLRPRRPDVAIGADARCRVQHRVRRRDDRSELAEPALPPRVRRAWPVQDVRKVEREVPRARRQRPRRDAHGTATRRPDQGRERARRNRAVERWHLQADVPRRLRNDDRDR